MCMSISARRSCGAQRSHGDGSSVRLVDRASTLSSYGMGATYQGSNSPEPAADTRILGRLALSEGAESSRRASAPWKALLASGRPVLGLLSVGKLAQHHVVLGPSPNPRGGTLSRPPSRKTDAPLTRSAAQR